MNQCELCQKPTTETLTVCIYCSIEFCEEHGSIEERCCEDCKDEENV